MNSQIIKNVVLFGIALALWLILITIEVFTGYSGLFLQAVYALSLLAVFVTFWLVNRSIVVGIKSEALQMVSCGAIAVALTGLFLIMAVVVGVNFKFLIGGGI